MIESKINKRVLCLNQVMFSKVVQCSVGYMLFRRVICCSGGLYAVQGGYMLFRRVIWMFIMVKIVATTVVASRPPNGDRLQRRPLVPKW